MYTIKVNQSEQFKTELKITGSVFEGKINNAPINGSFIKINDYQYHIIINNTSYNILVMKVNSEEKTLVVKINSVKFNLKLKDKYDELLQSLGMDSLSAKKISNVKAPMPGMVVSVLVAEGAEIKKGDALIVLEAMKMENILKSPSDGVVKKIIAAKGKSVEKNEILIQL